MTLRGFHILFILVATLLLFGLAAYEFWAWQRAHSALDLGFAAGLLVCGVGMGIYGAWYSRKTRRSVTL